MFKFAWEISTAYLYYLCRARVSIYHSLRVRLSQVLGKQSKSFSAWAFAFAFRISCIAARQSRAGKLVSLLRTTIRIYPRIYLRSERERRKYLFSLFLSCSSPRWDGSSKVPVHFFILLRRYDLPGVSELRRGTANLRLPLAEINEIFESG